MDLRASESKNECRRQTSAEHVAFPVTAQASGPTKAQAISSKYTVSSRAFSKNVSCRSAAIFGTHTLPASSFHSSFFLCSPICSNSWQQKLHFPLLDRKSVWVFGSVSLGFLDS